MKASDSCENSIVFAADHNGVALKSQIIEYLGSKGYNCIDLGPYGEDIKVDYVDYAKQLGHIIDKGQVKRGIIICGTGVGMSIVVNKFPNVRAALVHNIDTSRKCREHNDANVLCLGAWITTKPQTLEIVDNWLEEPFGEGRHVKRVEKIAPHDRENVVFTNGIFDLMHTGHIDLLKFAKNLGGRLIVGINSDKSVEKLGKKVVNPQEDRRKVLESVEFVDEVIIFEEDKPTKLVEILKPNVVVKGGEWTAEEVRQRDKIPKEISVKVFPLVEDTINVNMIKKIKDNSSGKNQ